MNTERAERAKGAVGEEEAWSKALGPCCCCCCCCCDSGGDDDERSSTVWWLPPSQSTIVRKTLHVPSAAAKKARERQTLQPLTHDHNGHLLPVPALGLSLVSTLILSFRSTCHNALEPRLGFVARFKSPYSIHEGRTNHHEDSRVYRRSTKHVISRRSRSSSSSVSAAPA